MIFEAIMKSVTVGEFIVETQNTFPGSSGELSKILIAIKFFSKIVSHHINKAGLAKEILDLQDWKYSGETTKIRCFC